MALLATALGFGVVQLDVTAVNVAVHSIGRALDANVAGLQWTVNAYTLGLAALILSAGTLADRVGAKRLYLGGFALFTLASAACGLSENLSQLIVARSVQGVGAAVLIPCSLTLLSHAYPDENARRRAVGIWAACASVALALGPLVGGFLTEILSWRAIFFINAPLGVLGILLALRYTAETPKSARAIDIPGQVLVIVGLGLLASALIEGGQVGFVSPVVLFAFAGSAVALAAFVVVESRAHEPMLRLTLFGKPAFAAGAAIGLLINISFYGLIFVLSLYFQTALELGPLGAGLAFVPTAGAVFIGNLLAGRIVSAVGQRWTLASGALLTALALAGLLVIGPHTAYPDLVAQLFVLGLGLGIVVPTITAAILENAPSSSAGVASGTLNSARQVGSVVGVALFGALASTNLVAGLRESIAIAVGLAVVCAILSLAISARGAEPR
jgi:DHA2 family methylenomycin A resistance protein-like MFS transporter